MEAEEGVASLHNPRTHLGRSRDSGDGGTMEAAAAAALRDVDIPPMISEEGEGSLRRPLLSRLDLSDSGGGGPGRGPDDEDYGGGPIGVDSLGAADEDLYEVDATLEDTGPELTLWQTVCVWVSQVLVVDRIVRGPHRFWRRIFPFMCSIFSETGIHALACLYPIFVPIHEATKRHWGPFTFSDLAAFTFIRCSRSSPVAQDALACLYPTYVPIHIHQVLSELTSGASEEWEEQPLVFRIARWGPKYDLF